MVGNVYKVEEGVYFDAIGNGSIGMMYYRDLGISVIATFDNPSVELSAYEIVTDPVEKRLIQMEIVSIEVMTNIKKAP